VLEIAGVALWALAMTGLLIQTVGGGLRTRTLASQAGRCRTVALQVVEISANTSGGVLLSFVQKSPGEAANRLQQFDVRQGSAVAVLSVISSSRAGKPCRTRFGVPPRFSPRCRPVRLR